LHLYLCQSRHSSEQMVLYVSVLNLHPSFFNNPKYNIIIYE
jgi:hypothetical protein